MDQSEEDASKSVKNLSMKEIAKAAEKKLKELEEKCKNPAEQVSD